MARVLPALLACLALAACGGGTAAVKTHRPAAAANSAASPQAGATAGGAAGALAPAAAGGTVAGSSQSTGTIDPGPLHLPQAGTYPAQMTRSGSTQPVSISVSESRVSSTVTDVTTTTTLSGGNQQISSEQWRPDGIYLTETSYVYSGKRIDCTFQAPVLESKLPLRVGLQWSSSGTCTTPAPNASTTTLNLAASVTGTARQVIGGTSAAVYLVKAQLTTDTQGTSPLGGVAQPGQPFDLKTTSQLTLYVDAAAGMDVHTITNSTTDMNGSTSSSTSEIVLTSVKPS